jgi:hypothetical protein
MMARGCALGVLAGLLVVAFESDFQGKICEDYHADKDCDSYNIFFYAAWQTIKFLDRYSALITAIATGTIGYFTFTLKASTDRLWTAAKGQIAAAENAAKIQSADMQASIAVADKAANAARKSASVAEQVLYGTEAP